MSHFIFHVLIREVAYPAFYWIGFAVVKSMTAGKANIMQYSDVGTEEDAAWWEFRIRRWGFTEWRPESMIIIGGCFFLFVVSGYYVWRYLV